MRARDMKRPYLKAIHAVVLMSIRAAPHYPQATCHKCNAHPHARGYHVPFGYQEITYRHGISLAPLPIEVINLGFPAMYHWLSSRTPVSLHMVSNLEALLLARVLLSTSNSQSKNCLTWHQTHPALMSAVLSCPSSSRTPADLRLWAYLRPRQVQGPPLCSSHP